MKKTFLAALGLFCLAATAAPAPMARAADDPAAWPKRQVTIVVPFGAGGTTDVFGRIVASHLQARYNQAFVIENKPGAGGNLGAAQVAKAAPDGYTLLLGTVSTHAINPSLYKQLPYDTEKDFQPVSGIASLPNMLVIRPTIPARTLPEFITYLKDNPGKLNYASSGAGTSQHLAAELFAMKTGTRVTHVPFRSSNDIMNALTGGHVDFSFDNITLALPQAQSGALRALGVTSPQRSPAAPDVPAIAETIPGFDATSWNGIWAPAGTPKVIVDKLAADIAAIMAMPDVQKRCQELASTPTPSTPAQFAAFIAGERTKWAEVVKAVGIQIGQ